MIDFVPNKNIVAVANDRRNGRITTSSVTFSLYLPKHFLSTKLKFAFAGWEATNLKVPKKWEIATTAKLN